MKKYDTVIINSTKEVCTIQKVETTSMGRSVYYLNSKEFVSNYPFYEQDITLVDEELLHNGYDEYLDAGRPMKDVLEECDKNTVKGKDYTSCIEYLDDTYKEKRRWPAKEIDPNAEYSKEILETLKTYAEHLDEGRSMRSILEECDKMENFEGLDVLAPRSTSTGTKFDNGKLRHSLLVPEFIEELLDVLEFGAQKYAAEAWKTETIEQDSLDALYRHYLKHLKGQEYDVESGCAHLAHIACRAMFAFYHMKNSDK